MICPTCGKEHPAEEMELTFRRPDEVAQLSTEERSQLVLENADLCVLEGKRFFIRSLLPLPVASRAIPYRIGLWVEVSRASFDRVYQLWDAEEQVHEPPFAARLANEIPAANGSLGLRAALQLTGPKTRPEVFLEQCSHLLYMEQAHGIDEHRVYEYAALIP